MAFSKSIRLSLGSEYSEVDVGGKSVINAASASSTFVLEASKRLTKALSCSVLSSCRMGCYSN
jgi:hypothetical protein